MTAPPRNDVAPRSSDFAPPNNDLASPNPFGRRVLQAWLDAGMAAVFGVAFAARLVPLLRGGGLYAAGNYDDGVHYAAAMGLVHGLLPYRDFLFLHPPGIAVLARPIRLCWPS